MEINLPVLALIIVGMFLFSHEAHDSVGLNLVMGIRILIKVVLWYVFFILLSACCVRLCRRVRQLWGQGTRRTASTLVGTKRRDNIRERSQVKVCSLQEELQKLRSQAQHWEMLHRDREQTLAIMKEELTVCKAELAFHKQDRQQLLSAQEQSRLEVGSLQEELKKLSIRAQNWEQLQFEALKSQTAQKEELASLRRDGQQLLSDLKQSRQEIRSLQEDRQMLNRQSQDCQKFHWDTLKCQAAFEEELVFHRQARQQVHSAQEQSRQEVGSLRKELKKLSIRAQNWEQVQFDALQSQTAQAKELASLKQDRQQLLSAQEQC